MPSISGQSILVIGGTSGIGFAVAKLALKENVRVTIASSNETKVNTAVDKLRSAFSHDQITGHVVKLGGEETEAQLDKLLIDVTASGPLDHVVYTAGSPVLRPFQEIDFKYVQESGRLGLSAQLLLAKLVRRYVKDGYTSSLILTGGQVGEKPYKGWTVYAAYASALYGMTRNLALDLAPIRVNLVSPGRHRYRALGREEGPNERNRGRIRTAG
jgi:NAD(P)-dependent dehydrogenase (short-subunit alcohol dehydrogenase family)